MRYDYSSAIPEEVRADIVERLGRIEQEEDVQIFLAVESGSRAWGFPSVNSDYDVRFLYTHRPEWYLSIDVEKKRDVIERPIVDHVDVGGWDIRKALMLLRKSNPPLLEWLQSPIIYCEHPDIAQRFRALLPEYYSPTASLYHYLNMAKGNFKEYLQHEEVRTKKYFYVLRPLLAIKWVEEQRGPVPMEFQTLVDQLITDPPLLHEVETLLQKKRSGQELDSGPRIQIFNDFIEHELERMEGLHVESTQSKPDIEGLNQFFRWAINH